MGLLACLQIWFFILCLSLFPYLWNRDFARDRDFGREVSSGGDVSSMKSKPVCAFYFLYLPLFFHGLLCDICFYSFLNLKFGQQPHSYKRTECHRCSHFLFWLLKLFGNELFQIHLSTDNRSSGWSWNGCSSSLYLTIFILYHQQQMV